MNKKMNTLLFVLGATVFNVITAIIAFIILFIIYLNFLHPILPESASSWSFMLLFLGSIVTSFFVYRAVLKAVIKKIDIEKYFDPLFASRYKKPKPPSSS